VKSNIYQFPVSSDIIPGLKTALAVATAIPLDTLPLEAGSFIYTMDCY